MTLFLGVLDVGLLSRCDPEEKGHSTEALTGVRRIPFGGLFTGLCLVGVSTAAGDLKGLPLKAIWRSQEPPATGLSATEKILEEGGVLGVPGVPQVLGVLGVATPWTALPRLPGDFVGVLFGL